MWSTVAKCCKSTKPNVHLEHRRGLYICCNECSDQCQSCCSCEFGTMCWSVHVTVSLDNGCLYDRGIEYYVLPHKNNHITVYAHHQSDPSVISGSAVVGPVFLDNRLTRYHYHHLPKIVLQPYLGINFTSNRLEHHCARCTVCQQLGKFFVWVVDQSKGTCGMANIFSRLHTTGILPVGSLETYGVVTSCKA